MSRHHPLSSSLSNSSSSEPSSGDLSAAARKEARSRKSPRARKTSAPLRCEVPVTLPNDPIEYAKFEARVLAVVPGRRYDDTQTPARRRYQLRAWANNDAWRRYTNTAFRFFEFCGELRCKRAQSCVGDPHACFVMIWPHVDADFKFHLRAVAQGIRQGLNKEEALKFASAALAEHKRYEERERRKAEAPAEPAHEAAAGAPPREVAPATSRERSLARVRLL